MVSIAVMDDIGWWTLDCDETKNDLLWVTDSDGLQPKSDDDDDDDGGVLAQQTHLIDKQ